MTNLFDLSRWPARMRLIVRKERPHPGAQLRITDVDGHRLTAFVTNSTTGQLADLKLRHRRARAEDRIRCAKDTGLTNLPLHDFAQNQIWCAPRRPGLRAHRLDADPRPHRFPGPPVGTQTAAAAAVHVPATLARTGRRRLLHLTDHHPWAITVSDAIARLRALATGPAPAPG